MHLLALAVLFAADVPDTDPVVVRPTVLKQGVKGKWSAEAKLLKVSGGGALGRRAGEDLFASESAFYLEFVKDAKAFFLTPAFSSAEWGFASEISLKRTNGKMLSFLVDSYAYRGGAHGIDVKRTYNFGYVHGKVKRLSLTDCLAGPSAMRELKMRLLEKAMVAPGTDWIEDGEVNDFTQEELDRFWISGKGLVFEFNPYELGSYASGPFTFTLSWKELQGLVSTTGPLGSLVK